MADEYVNHISKIEIHNLFDCSSGFVDPEDCSWYHENWTILRALDLVSNPFWHESFFANQLMRFYRYGDRLLVLGTADFSMPLLCSRCGVKQIDICDICNTPLNICNAIAKKENLDWRTIRRDIRDGIEPKYNIIINDAFLTRFDYSEKSNILHRMSQMLVNNGVYITTIRNDWNAGKPLAPSALQQAAFVDKAIKISSAKGFDIVDVEKSARQYIKHMISYPIQDEATLFSICENRLDIIHCDKINVIGEVAETSYFQIVFQKINSEKY